MLRKDFHEGLPSLKPTRTIPVPVYAKFSIRPRSNYALAMSKHQMKVVIVGGSIAGLTLAHCLSHYGIDYVVLERRHDIAPQVGASVSLQPNGARILDQLGMFDEVSENIEPCVFMQTWTAEGKLLSETDAPILTGKR
jgi:ribulose 1,5-bisphosphate synthetase/thiazole synthase